VTLWPDALVVDGTALPLAELLADVTVHHGRATTTDEPTASTLQATILGVDKAFVEAFRVGVSLELTVTDGTTSRPRFTGRVTDARLDGDSLTVIGVARLATLGSYAIGDLAEGVWPVEAWSARVQRIFASAGLSSSLVLELDPTFDPTLAARDPATAGATTLADYLAFLAPMLGAAVVDLADGTILVQAIGARTIDSRLELDPADVGYVPAWTQVLPAGNIVTVRYTGDQSQSVTVDEPSSRAFYGDRPRTIDTAFTQSSDATRRAQTALARGAFSHWNIPEAPVLRGLELRVGEPVTLSQMPASSPFEPWTPIVEGWTDELNGPAWTMLLALSDPLESGLVLPWDAVPTDDPAFVWQAVDPATDWTEALTLEALHAG